MKITKPLQITLNNPAYFILVYSLLNFTLNLLQAHAENRIK